MKKIAKLMFILGCVAILQGCIVHPHGYYAGYNGAGYNEYSNGYQPYGYGRGYGGGRSHGWRDGGGRGWNGGGGHHGWGGGRGHHH